MNNCIISTNTAYKKDYCYRLASVKFRKINQNKNNFDMCENLIIRSKLCA